MMVYKKDFAWHMGLDYKHLNMITTKDTFPIHAIVELLDDLQGTILFTNLDSCSGYHHIKLREEYILKTSLEHMKFVMSF